MAPVLVLVTASGGAADEVALQALALGRRLAGGGPVHALVTDEAAAATLGAWGATSVHVARHAAFERTAPDALARTMVDLGGGSAPNPRRPRARRPATRCSPGPPPGRASPSPRTASPPATRRRSHDCHPNALGRQPPGGGGAAREPGVPDRRAPRHPGRSVGGAGRLRRDVPGRSSTPRISSSGSSTACPRRPRASRSPMRRSSSAAAAESGRPRASKPIEELAGLLGAAVGCSRAVTISGWRSHTDQVGQTGTKIAPEPVHRRRHQRRDPAHGRGKGRQEAPRDQQGR